MGSLFKFGLSLVLFSFLLLALSSNLQAKTECDDLSPEEKAKCLTGLIQEYESKIVDLQGKQRTLATTIKVLDNQIGLTQTQIQATEEEVIRLEKEIQKLFDKIGQLDDVLTDISQVLGARIEATYKRLFVSPIYFLLSSGDITSLLSRVQYLRSAQYHDRELMFNIEETRLDFDRQKALKEQKQKELEVLQKRLNSQKLLLDQQKSSKQELLVVTKNDEKTFQDLLGKARAEFEAIQSILAGKGDEVKVGGVNEGEKIASIIKGVSACSTGTHLHFEVAQNGAHTNPASWLKNVDVDWDNCWLGQCDPQFSFSGSWNWPVNGKPKITQGYGMSAYAKWGAYGGGPHTGIDIVVDDLSVKTVKNGTLYRGSIACGGGTLRYVKVDHQDSDVDTYYLHINYVR